MRQPEEAPKLLEKAPTSIFVTDFNRKVYEAVLEIARSEREFSLSSLNEVFSADEMGKIYGIQAKNDGISINNASISDCIAVLKNHKKIKSPEDISDDDLMNAFKKS
jgi:hypothetical protein